MTSFMKYEFISRVFHNGVDFHSSGSLVSCHWCVFQSTGDTERRHNVHLKTGRVQCLGQRYWLYLGDQQCSGGLKGSHHGTVSPSSPCRPLLLLETVWCGLIAAPVSVNPHSRNSEQSTTASSLQESTQNQYNRIVNEWLYHERHWGRTQQTNEFTLKETELNSNHTRTLK